MKTPDYLSYDRYKKKKKASSKNGFLIAVTTFFAALLLFTIIAKNFSPNVDVAIGNNSLTDVKESGLGVKKFIDERLKRIQMEDETPDVYSNYVKKKNPTFIDKTSEKLSDEIKKKIGSSKNKVRSNNSRIKEEPIELNPQVLQTPLKTTSKPTNKDLSIPFMSVKISKVFVGNYTTIAQAKVAQGILLDSGINITPFIKNLGGSYTLQVGSYSSKAKAEALALELSKNNFPARVVRE